MTRNMTDKILKEVFKQLPKELEIGELSSLLMTLTSTYMEQDTNEAVKMLLTTTIIYASSAGLPRDVLAKAFYGAAEGLSVNPYTTTLKDRIN